MTRLAFAVVTFLVALRHQRPCLHEPSERTDPTCCRLCGRVL